MKYTAKLISGSFEYNTMTFEVNGKMILQEGNYSIEKIELTEKPVEFISGEFAHQWWFNKIPLFWRYLWYFASGVGIGLYFSL